MFPGCQSAPRAQTRVICRISLAPAIPHTLKASEQLPGSAVWDPKVHPNVSVALIFLSGPEMTPELSDPTWDGQRCAGVAVKELILAR